MTTKFGPTQVQVLVPMQWANGVTNVGLMDLLFKPHFSHSSQVNTYMKQLLVCFHRGCLWLDQPYPIDVELISSIIGFLKKGKDPTPYLNRKDTARIN